MQEAKCRVKAADSGEPVLDASPAPQAAAQARAAQLWRLMWRDVCAGLAATSIEFVFYNVLVEVLGMLAARASMCGCLLGGVINFLVNRFWTYRSGSPLADQAGRYAFTSWTGAALNGLIMTALSQLAWPHRVRWALTQWVVWAGWNFPMHRYFVFAGGRGRSAPSAIAGE